jgi:hypothetical protein
MKTSTCLSFCMKVLAASRNKISTLKGFPHLPSLEVRVSLCSHKYLQSFISFLDKYFTSVEISLILAFQFSIFISLLCSKVNS